MTYLFFTFCFLLIFAYAPENLFPCYTVDFLRVVYAGTIATLSQKLFS